MASSKKNVKNKEKKLSIADILDKMFNRSFLDYELIFNMINKTGFNYDKKQKIFYSRLDAWQHNVGYFNLYDKAAPFALMFIHCEPIRFKYDNRSWKIEFWKGQYGICTGAEIGIYTGGFDIDSKKIKNEHLIKLGKDTQCAGIRDWLQMSFTLYKNKEKLFTRNSDDPKTPGIDKHWWLTGFKPGVISTPSDLNMEISIVLKDTKMLNAFVDGLKKANYEKKDIKINDLTVDLIFAKPKTKQPW